MPLNRDPGDNRQKRAAQLRAVREALGKSQKEFMDMLNRKINTMYPDYEGQFIKTAAIYGNYEKVRTVIRTPVSDAFEKIKGENLDKLGSILNDSKNYDPRRDNTLPPLGIIPSILSEDEMVKYIKKYEGEYICYYDLNQPSLRTTNSVIFFRKYVISGFDERDGSLVGQFYSEDSSRKTGVVRGSVKFLIIPSLQDAFYIMEYDKGSDIPPAVGIFKAESYSGNSYFYGMLMGVRGAGRESIVAVKCLMLRQRSTIDAVDEFSQKLKEIERSNSFEVSESELGSYAWKLIKYFLNGIDGRDGQQCLHVWTRFSYFGNDERIHDDLHLGEIVDEIYANKQSIVLPASSETRHRRIFEKLQRSTDSETPQQ